MKTVRTQAIVLRRTNYGEADRILQLLTIDGRRSVMARGVRKEKSRLAGGIELFAVSDVVIGEGRGELGVLTSAKLIRFYRYILKDYDRLQFGYRAIKLIARATETVDEPDWFDLLNETLAGLDVITIPVDLIKCWFYLRYSSLLGRELNLELDAAGNKLLANEKYYYDVSDQGLRLAESNSSKEALSGDHIKLLRLIATRPLSVLVQIGGIDSLLKQCLFLVETHAALEP